MGYPVDQAMRTLLWTKRPKIIFDLFPEIQAKYDRKPWSVSQTLGRLFTAVETLGEPLTVWIRAGKKNDENAKWWRVSHALGDGQTFITAVASEEKIKLKRVNLKQVVSAKDSKANRVPKRKSAPFQGPVPELKTDAGFAQLGWIEFSKEESVRINRG